MAFATTDRMDGVAGGYNRPSARGTASRSTAAEGFDRILSAARAPQAAETRRAADAPARRDPGPAQSRTDAGRDAGPEAKVGSSATSRAADRLGDARENATNPRGSAPADVSRDPAETSAADAGPATDGAAPRADAMETADAAVAVAAEPAAPQDGPDTVPSPVAVMAGAADPNGQAAQSAPVSQMPAEMQATQIAPAAEAAQAFQAGAGQVRTSVTTVAEAGAPKKTDDETEKVPTDPTAPAALPAFLALLATPPAPTPALGGAVVAATEAGGGSATAVQGGALAPAALAAAPGQGPGGFPAQASGDAVASAAETLAAAVRGAQGSGDAKGGVQPTEDAEEAGAKETAGKEAGTKEAGVRDAAAKPDLLAALVSPVTEPGSAAAGQAAGQGLAQAAAPGLGQAGAAHGAAHAAADAATAPATPPVQIGQVPMTIGLRALSGSNQFEIRLDPLELGRIDVKLEIDKERGTVMTHMVVERVETLAMLQRDANSLQQALSQAGLDAQEGGINLSLRGDGQSDGRTGDQAGGQAGGQDSRAPRSAWVPETERAAEAPLRGLGSLGGLDIRI